MLQGASEDHHQDKEFCRKRSNTLNSVFQYAIEWKGLEMETFQTKLTVCEIMSQLQQSLRVQYLKAAKVCLSYVLDN